MHLTFGTLMLVDLSETQRAQTRGPQLFPATADHRYRGERVIE